MISKVCTYYPVRVRDIDSETPTLESILNINEFFEAFFGYFESSPPKKEIDFGVDLLPNIQPISIPPYHIDLSELKELDQISLHGVLECICLKEGLFTLNV